DIYAGIDFQAGSPEAMQVLDFFKDNLPKEFKKVRFGVEAQDEVGVGLKPISRPGTERLVKAAIEYALQFKRKSVTLVHKGNIMKYTEGAFRDWSYAAAERLFGNKVFTWAQYERIKAQKGEDAANLEQKAALRGGALLIKDA